MNRGVLEAEFDRESNTFTVTPSEDFASEYSILINPRLVDVSRPVRIVTPEGERTVEVAPDREILEASLRETGDPYLAWVQEINMPVN